MFANIVATNTPLNPSSRIESWYLASLVMTFYTVDSSVITSMDLMRKPTSISTNLTVFIQRFVIRAVPAELDACRKKGIC